MMIIFLRDKEFMGEKAEVALQSFQKNSIDFKAFF